MHYIRVYSDANGKSHFADLEMPFEQAGYAPPAPPVGVSPFQPATRYGFLRASPGWFGDWHPVPGRQLHIYVAGELEIEVGDGEVRRLGPGAVALMDDTTGPGHVSRVVSDVDIIIAVVRLEE